MRRGQVTVPGAGIDGARLRERRTELGLTQAELAQRSGISQEAISRIENGRIRGLMQPTQDALAAALDASVAWLRGGTDDDDAAEAPSSGALELGFDEDDPLVEAVGHAFNPARHTMLDSFAVLRTLRATDRRLVQGDLLDAARRWLDAAASLRREGLRVSIESLLMRLTAGEGPSEPDPDASRARADGSHASSPRRRHG